MGGIVIIKFIDAYNSYLDYIDNRLKIQSKNSLKGRFESIILPYFKDYDLEDIDVSLYVRFQNELVKKDYSYNYMKSIHSILVNFFNYCSINYNLSTNVASRVGNVKVHKIRKEQDFYNFYEFKRFIKFMDNKVYKLFFITMFTCGTRPGEAMALKFSDLHKYFISINKTIDEHHSKDSGLREITTPKTLSSIRDINITRKLYKNLIKLKKYYIDTYNTEDDFYIFGGIKPLALTTLNRYKKNACERAKLRCIKLHEFRHSHATYLSSKNIPIKVISKRLGHSNTDITLNTYIHFDKMQEKRVLHTLKFLRLPY